MEEKTEVRTFIINYKCPQYKKGYLKPGNIVLTSHPPKYPHKCDNPECDYGETFSFRYPKTVVEKIE